MAKQAAYQTNQKVQNLSRLDLSKNAQNER